MKLPFLISDDNLVLCLWLLFGFHLNTYQHAGFVVRLAMILNRNQVESSFQDRLFEIWLPVKIWSEPLKCLQKRLRSTGPLSKVLVQCCNLVRKFSRNQIWMVDLNWTVFELQAVWIAIKPKCKSSIVIKIIESCFDWGPLNSVKSLGEEFDKK